ncbi:MAG: amidophosphoribosyltransferase, partial [Campylobacteraceae bacterium]|nr:amidophosphoribosyltransferase [Campylobacteraceae bacterium]
AQPLLTHSIKGDLAIAHNGNLVQSEELKKKIESLGSIFHSTLDTEIIAHLVARSLEDNIVDALLEVLHQVKGAFSIVAIANDTLVGARDPFGFRPLSLGRLGDDYVIASETCAFDAIGAEFIRDIEPGEAVIVNDKGIKSCNFTKPQRMSFCIFEFIYFARPDSVIAGKSVYAVRQEMGKAMAREHKIEADLVIPVPDSGVSAAMGYAQESGIPFEMGIVRNHYVGRTFIEPTQARRDMKVKLKLSPIKAILKNKRIIVVDDSIVRGTTSKRIIRILKEAGAKEVHMCITSPTIEHPCKYGIDTPSYEELISANMSVEEIRAYIKADSLSFLSIDSLKKSIGEDMEYSLVSFDGNYFIK